jgi:nicotinamide mononucleotide transporter
MRKILSYWTIWELLWLVLFSAMAVYITLATGDSFFGFIVFFSGVLCVLLVAKGNIYNYLVGMVSTVGYAWIASQNGLWGEVGLNILFYLPMNIIGFFLWRGHITQGIVVMKKMRARGLTLTTLLTIAGIALCGLGLSFIPTQNTPYIDAATTVLSIVATFLMIFRFREQWLCYITLNVLTVVMWSLRWLDGSPDGPLMVLMWSAYLLNAVYGMYNWSRGARRAELAAAATQLAGSLDLEK